MQYNEKTKEYIKYEIEFYAQEAERLFYMPNLNTYEGLKKFLLYLGRVNKKKRNKLVLCGNKGVIKKLNKIARNEMIELRRKNKHLSIK